MPILAWLKRREACGSNNAALCGCGPIGYSFIAGLYYAGRIGSECDLPYRFVRFRRRCCDVAAATYGSKKGWRGDSRVWLLNLNLDLVSGSVNYGLSGLAIMHGS